MNHVTLTGRLTRDPDVRYMNDGKAVARYSLAVDRGVRKQDNQQTVDFINCVAFGKAGEFAEKHLRKGTKILIEGRIQTGSYINKQGQKVSTFDVVISRHEFVESKREAQNDGRQDAPADEFVPIPDNVDDVGLPFN